MSVHFSPSFRTCAPLAGPGAYCSRSLILFSLSALPLHQLCDLNEIAAGVVQHGDLGARHVLWWRGELGALCFHTLVVGLHVLGEEHGRGLALLEDGLLVCFRRRVAVERQLQLRAVLLLGRDYGQPTIWALAKIVLLGKAQHLGIEAQCLLLVVHV